MLRAVKQGRVSLEPDGTVDAAKADASWERSSDPARRKTPSQKLRPVAEAALGSVRERGWIGIHLVKEEIARRHRGHGTV